MSVPADSTTVTLLKGAPMPQIVPRRSPDWLTICWAVGCGWDHKAHTDEAARALKADHVEAHPGHRVIVVRV